MIGGIGLIMSPYLLKCVLNDAISISESGGGCRWVSVLPKRDSGIVFCCFSTFRGLKMVTRWTPLRHEVETRHQDRLRWVMVYKPLVNKLGNKGL